MTPRSELSGLTSKQKHIPQSSRMKKAANIKKKPPWNTFRNPGELIFRATLKMIRRSGSPETKLEKLVAQDSDVYSIMQ